MTSALKHESARQGNNAICHNRVDDKACEIFPPEIVWGAEAISRVTGEPEVRKTFYRLEKGLIPGAGKMGSRYFLSIPAFRRAVHGDSA